MSLDGKGCAEAYNHRAVVLGTIIICHITQNVLYLFRPDLYPVRYWCNDPIFPVGIIKVSLHLIDLNSTVD